MAESWLVGQEPLVRTAELGSNVDEVESLIKRHEAFEKLAAGWEERFTLLEKLTTVYTHTHTRFSSACSFIHYLYFTSQLEQQEIQRRKEEEERARRPPTPPPVEEVVQSEAEYESGARLKYVVSSFSLINENGSLKVK